MKKILNISILLVFITNNILMASPSILADAMWNITKPGTFKSYDSNGNLQEMDFYSGGVSFHFANNTPPAIFTLSPPSIEAGCNGINIKGMFMSLLGLNQLGKMLQNAGASLAWGVAVGLIYSLPGVASAFKMINQWAKDLQKLLGNACQSGIAIGQQLAKSAGLDKEKMEKKIMNAMPDWASCGQERENCVVHALGLDKYFNSDGVFNFNFVGSDELSPEDKADAVMKLLHGVFDSDIAVGSSFMTHLVKSDTSGHMFEFLAPNIGTVNANQAFNFGYFSLTLSKGSGGTSDASGNSVKLVGIDDLANQLPAISDRRKIKISIWSYILIYNFIGDLVIKNTNNKIQEALNLAKGVIKDNQTDKEKGLKAKENIDSMENSLVMAGPGANIDPITAGRTLANFIFYGKTNSPVSKLGMPGFVLVSSKEEKTAKRAFRIIERDPGEWSRVESVPNYRGVEFSSNCAVRKAIWGDKRGIQSSCSEVPDTFPVLIENIDYFVKVIQNSPDLKQEELTQALVKYNEYKVANGLLDKIMSVLQDVDSTPTYIRKQSSGGYSDSTEHSGVADKTGAKEQAAYYAKAGITLKSAHKYIDQITGNLKDYKTVEGIFKKQEVENQIRGFKRLKK